MSSRQHRSKLLRTHVALAIRDPFLPMGYYSARYLRKHSHPILIKTSVVDWPTWRISSQSRTIRRPELLLLEPHVCRFRQLLDFREGEFRLGVRARKEVVDALSIVGTNVVHLCEVLLLFGRQYAWCD